MLLIVKNKHCTVRYKKKGTEWYGTQMMTNSDPLLCQFVTISLHNKTIESTLLFEIDLRALKII